jgi:uncharacterized protein DUF6594
LTVHQLVENCPKGYPRTAAFLSSDPHFSVYRRFGYLHSRVLLDLQDQISILEIELDKRDEIDAENGRAHLLQSRLADVRAAKKEPNVRSRRDVLADIKSILLEYGEFVSFHAIATCNDQSVAKLRSR